jgi:xylulokinase
MPVLIGVDVGTTHLKAAAFDLAGRVLVVASQDTPISRLSGDRAEFDLERIWQGVTKCLREVRSQVPEEVLGVGIASMGESGALLDAQGQVLFPAIAWFDMRAHAEANAIIERDGLERLYQQTGLLVSAKYSLPKIIWLARNHPERFALAQSYLNMAEYIAYRLTGETAACPTLAARTAAFDLAANAWCDERLEAMDIPASLFQPVLPEGTLVGRVRPECQAETGLEQGTPVAIGGHDHPCASLAAGLNLPYQLLDSTGTVEALIGTLEAPILDRRAFENEVSQGRLPVPGLYGLLNGLSTSGAVLEWWRREFAPNADYAALAELAGGVAGPSGLVFVPHLAGSINPRAEPNARASMLGFTLGTTQAQVVKALLEGTCFELRRMLEGMEALIAKRFDRIILTGGHTKNPVWSQLKADVLGRTLEVPEVSEATLLGAALLGGVAGGVYRDAAQASASIERPSRTIVPRDHAAFEVPYQRYLQTLKGVTPVYRDWTS